jgi:hypothetical protein
MLWMGNRSGSTEVASLHPSCWPLQQLGSEDTRVHFMCYFSVAFYNNLGSEAIVQSSCSILLWQVSAALS